MFNLGGCCAPDARDDAWDSIGRPHGQIHGQSHACVVASSWLGSDSCTVAKTLYACMFMCEFDAQQFLVKL